MIPEIQRHPTWDILDSSKITCAMTCLRKYWFEYILGWRIDAPNIHFEFGKAWHAAMDVLFRHGCTMDNYDLAIDAFIKVYRQSYAPEDEQDGGVKTSTNARGVLQQYIETYQHDNFKVLGIEIPGQVNITDDWALTLRMDLIVEDEHGRIVIPDHKTTTASSATWRAQWPMSFQLCTYIHAANCIFGVDKVYGALINGTVLRKPIALKKDGTPYANMKGSEFIRVPVVKTHDQMEMWLDIARYYVNEVKTNEALLDDCNADTQTMRAFPCNPSSCTKYNTVCPFMPFCTARSNPLSLVQQLEGRAPVGYKIEYWDPTKADKSSEEEEL